MRARLCVRPHTARYRAGAARAHAVREGVHGRKPRPCAVDSPPLSRRRLATLCAGHPEPFRLPRFFPRPNLRPRRHAGGVGRAGRAGALTADEGVTPAHLPTVLCVVVSADLSAFAALPGIWHTMCLLSSGSCRQDVLSRRLWAL